MARRSDHSREELYDMALAAARDIVAEGGLQALTARKIGEAIGYSPGTLYNIFADLDDLIVHLNGRTLDALYACLSWNQGAEEPCQDLNLLVERYLDFLERHANLFNALIEHRLPDSREAPGWYTEKVERLLGLVEAALAPLVSGRRTDAARAAEVFWASLHGICSLSDSGKLQVISDQSRREMAEFLVACFTAGLRRLDPNGWINPNI